MEVHVRTIAAQRAWIVPSCSWCKWWARPTRISTASTVTVPLPRLELPLRRPGSGTHSAGGAEHCNACGRNERATGWLGEGLAARYLLSRSSDLAECRPCPPGRWSQAGAVGLGSCRELVQCSSRDVQVTLTPCVQGQQQQKRSWLQPIRCNATRLRVGKELQDTGESGSASVP